jgi:DNA-directed RNA polymerase subunit M/transcription elongation factor TFIIS
MLVADSIGDGKTTVYQMTSRIRRNLKQMDDVLGGDETWAHADKTQGLPSMFLPELSVAYCSELSASCPNCNFNAAYFYQLQIRSADEPMTTCTSFVLCICKLLLNPFVSLSVCFWSIKLFITKS